MKVGKVVRWGCVTVIAVVSSVLLIGCEEAGTSGGRESNKVADGSTIEKLFFDYNGGALGAYNTEVLLEGPGTEIVFSLFDATDDIHLEPGQYIFGATDGKRCGFVKITDGMQGDSYAEYVASPTPESESPEGFTVGEYDQIMEGVVAVNRAESIYTIGWSFLTLDGGLISGAYTGAANPLPTE